MTGTFACPHGHSWEAQGAGGSEEIAASAIGGRWRGEAAGDGHGNLISRSALGRPAITLPFYVILPHP